MSGAAVLGRRPWAWTLALIGSAHAQVATEWSGGSVINLGGLGNVYSFA